MDTHARTAASFLLGDLSSRIRIPSGMIISREAEDRPYIDHDANTGTSGSLPIRYKPIYWVIYTVREPVPQPFVTIVRRWLRQHFLGREAGHIQMQLTAKQLEITRHQFEIELANVPISKFKNN